MGKGLAKDHTASEWQGWDKVPAPPATNPGLSLSLSLSLCLTHGRGTLLKSQVNREDLKLCGVDMSASREWCVRINERKRF